jgi:hypothetical protein
MMTAQLADEVRNALQKELPGELQGGLVTKFVICAAVMTTDGEHAFGLLSPPDVPAWDIMGMLEYGQDMARNPE